MDLKDLLAIVWKRRVTLLIVMAVAVAAAAAVAFTRTKMYKATATLAMTPNVHKGQGFVASDDLATLLSTYAAIVESRTSKKDAAQILGHRLDASVSASTTAGTGILKISATSASPRQAAAVAGALSQAFQGRLAGKNQLLEVQAVDPPTVPTAPVQPRPPLIIATGLLLGLGLGIALALMRERWFARIETVEDVTVATGLPTLGSVPRSRALRAGGRESLVWGRSELSHMQEAIRTLRTTLQFSMSPNETVIQVTSASTGEGKSTVAANLAVALAGVGVATVLVDADFRAPRQHVLFDLPNDRGLSTAMLMSGDGSGPHVQRTRFINLSVLTSGPVPPAPTELMATRIAQTIAHLRKLGAVIVLDTPPVLPVSDARLVARTVDLLLLVVAVGRTRSAALRDTLDHLHTTDVKIAGVVLNYARDSIGGYAGYGYGPQTHEQQELIGRH